MWISSIGATKSGYLEFGNAGAEKGSFSGEHGFVYDNGTLTTLDAPGATQTFAEAMVRAPDTTTIAAGSTAFWRVPRAVRRPRVVSGSGTCWPRTHARAA